MRTSVAFTIIISTFCSITFSQELLRPAGNYLPKDERDSSTRRIACASFVKLRTFENDTLKRSFWGDVNSSRSTLVSFAFDTAGSIYSELIVDNIGLWKISFSGAISSKSNDTVQSARAFFETGGNAIIKATYPVFVVYANDPALAKYRNAGVYFVTKLGANLPALGAYSTVFSGSIDSGLELHGSMATDSHEIIGFLSLRVAAVTGTKDFRSAWEAEHEKIFGYVRFSTGVIFKDFIRVGINFPVNILGGSNLKNQMPISISTGLIF